MRGHVRALQTSALFTSIRVICGPSLICFSDGFVSHFLSYYRRHFGHGRWAGAQDGVGGVRFEFGGDTLVVRAVRSHGGRFSTRQVVRDFSRVASKFHDRHRWSESDRDFARGHRHAGRGLVRR